MVSSALDHHVERAHWNFIALVEGGPPVFPAFGGDASKGWKHWTSLRHINAVIPVIRLSSGRERNSVKTLTTTLRGLQVDHHPDHELSSRTAYDRIKPADR